MSSQKKYGEDAGRRYDDKVEDFARSGKVEPAAEEAKRSIETPEGQKRYEQSVERGKHHQKE